MTARASSMRSCMISHRGLYGSQGEPARSRSAGIIWKAIGKRQGNEDDVPFSETKYMPKFSHADKE